MRVAHSVAILAVVFTSIICRSIDIDAERASKLVPPDLKIISREEWGWVPGGEFLFSHTISKITFHHTGEVVSESKDASEYLRSLQKYSRLTKNWADIPYHFMIDSNGNIYEARPINYSGDTKTDYDTHGHALIAIAGNYNVQNFTKNQLKAVVDLASFIADTYDISLDNIKGHVDYVATECPGEHFYRYIEDKTIQTLISRKIAGFDINYDDILIP